MKKKIIFLLALILILILLTTPMIEKETNTTIWETNGSITLHYSEGISKNLYLEESSNLKFLLEGEPMQDTLTISIYNSSNKEVISFAQVGEYRVVNWSVPDDGVYRFVFYNPVRWHKIVHISIVEVEEKKVNIIQNIFSGSKQ